LPRANGGEWEPARLNWFLQLTTWNLTEVQLF
jgi:hypothetical protein